MRAPLAPTPMLMMAACLAATVTGAAQRAATPLPLFRSAVELTTVTATVLDSDGTLVTDLPRDAFDVFEDGELQTISQFTNARVPVSLAILLDVSDSMFGRRIADAREAIAQFVNNDLDPADEFALVSFNHRQQVLTAWTDDRVSAASLLAPLRPFGSTAIYDAIVATVPFAETRHRQRMAILVISDGADTASDLSLRDLRTALYRTDAFVYAVAIDAADHWPINAPTNGAALTDITDQSGGRTKIVKGSAELMPALREIADELNSQYLIGYSSSKRADGQYHSIRVRVRGTEDRVRARRGYIAER